MSFEIAFVLGLVLLALLAFIWEKFPADVVALAVFCILVLSGVLPREKAMAVFANPAPVTVAALFGLSAFATRIGDQANTYVYGIGGYRFKDFVKIGRPLNVLRFGVAMYVIPKGWAF